MTRKRQTHIYDSDPNVEPYGVSEGEDKIGTDEHYTMYMGVDGDFSNQCEFCFRHLWNCVKQECRDRYKAKKEFERRQEKKWKGRPRKKKLVRKNIVTRK